MIQSLLELHSGKVYSQVGNNCSATIAYLASPHPLICFQNVILYVSQILVSFQLSMTQSSGFQSLFRGLYNACLLYRSSLLFLEGSLHLINFVLALIQSNSG